MADGWRSGAEQLANVGPVTVWLAVGDIATLDVDAIVNAANDHGWMGSGVAGAIKRAGGAGIEEEAMRAAPRRPGTAWATGAGSLPARHVIHAAAMGQDLVTGEALVAAATHAAVGIARELGIRSLALPALGTGVGGFPLDRAAEVMGRAVAEEAGSDPGALGDVVFVLYDAAAAPEFTSALRSGLAPPPSSEARA